MIDKNNILKQLNDLPSVTLELGCGTRKRRASSIGIDIMDAPGVDIVGDVFDVLAAVPSATVDTVYASHFLEHVQPLPVLMDELERVLKPGGTLELIVPHFSNPHYYSDPTHRQTFGLYSMSYFAQDPILRRKVPHYGRTCRLELSDVRLEFKSSRPFYGRYAAKRLLHYIVNLCTWTREFYEENLCFILPCYEVRYRLKKT